MDSDSAVINTLEIRAFGLMRSGNHAIINWIMSLHAGRPVVFLNNVQHGAVDPYENCAQFETRPPEALQSAVALRSRAKQLLIYSYEDREELLAKGVGFLDSVLNPEFERVCPGFVGRSARRMDLMIIRDPFNFLASRLKMIEAQIGDGGVNDAPWIMNAWKELARRAIEIESMNPENQLVANYNRWVADKVYRESLAKRLGGVYREASIQSVPRYGGGSSFDDRNAINDKLSPRDLAKHWKKFLDPRRYAKLGSYWKRLTAPTAQKMKVTERWRYYEHDPMYRELVSDPEILDLSQQLFGEIPGTRNLVS